MKPYQTIEIQECGEPLVSIPEAVFSWELPHPYEKLGAPYGDRSPFFVRRGMLDRLIAAQQILQRSRPGWRVRIFDAYRPIEVQQFMVDYTFAEVVRSKNCNPDTLTDEQRQAIFEEVYRFWAVPSFDRSKPPPHSTGGAIDVTLVDEANQPINMGSPIDELSSRSYPNHFTEATTLPERQFHENRQILFNTMISAGFAQHPNEWWHFCFGDQLWAWLTHRSIARYGMAG
ncbi:MAG: D-alanyl-D-alanine dipeptidase [Cyanobacteria bacterium SID2]|nr:D-alanyl-D-alanine dipeptidase [Cyanobacteria bacterium SID2]MBP0006739.1 D-alanyl-D-alanine dipeptidase [Cyanobacteria bacterium SBC]